MDPPGRGSVLLDSLGFTLATAGPKSSSRAETCMWKHFARVPRQHGARQSGCPSWQPSTLQVMLFQSRCSGSIRDAPHHAAGSIVETLSRLKRQFHESSRKDASVVLRLCGQRRAGARPPAWSQAEPGERVEHPPCKANLRCLTAGVPNRDIGEYNRFLVCLRLRIPMHQYI